jgi:endonuclease/exonuclease/phosphatase family metal-dependent hydrolase
MAYTGPFPLICVRLLLTDMRFQPETVFKHLVFLCAVSLLFADVAVAMCPEMEAESAPLDHEFLRVVSLNVAHGRKDGKNQMLLKDETIRGNLEYLGVLLNRSQADVIALQEADAASRWSGNFDHVGFLAESTDYPCLFHGIHASNRIYDFGTALLSKVPFKGSFSHSFAPSKPTTTKGFSVAALQWNPGGSLEKPLLVKFVSIHLDFSRRSVRLSQVDELIRALSRLEGPMILMGDFNTDWTSKDSSLKYLADSMNLTAHKPQSEDFSTYGDKDKRLDWVLISKELSFSNYEVYPDIVSDHQAVVADVILNRDSK